MRSCARQHWPSTYMLIRPESWTRFACYAIARAGSLGTGVKAGSERLLGKLSRRGAWAARLSHVD